MNNNQALREPGESTGGASARELATYLKPAINVQREFVRFTRLQRTLHGCLVISFLSLATTGLTLKFSYTKWAVFLSRLLGGFQIAGFIHRFAAVVMFTAFIIHLVDLRQAEEEKVRHLARDAVRPEFHDPDEGRP